MAYTKVLIAACVALLAGCGEDDAPPPRPAGGTPAPAAAAAKPAGPTKPLVLQRTIEDQVRCAGPKEPDEADRCDPKTPIPCTDKKKKYCLVSEKNNQSYCAACNERETIRHVFRDRDFVAEQNRDPFKSYVLVPIGAGSAAKSVDMAATPKCNEFNSFAPSYSYQDLKVVGIVTQGTQRKALMTGGRASYIVKRSDCVGKEKAFVKEVGDGFVTFLAQPDPNLPDAPPVEWSTQLNNNALALNSLESPAMDRPAPSSVPNPTRTTPAPKDPSPGTTKIQIPAPTPTPTPTAPTQLTP